MWTLSRWVDRVPRSSFGLASDSGAEKLVFAPVAVQLRHRRGSSGASSRRVRGAAGCEGGDQGGALRTVRSHTAIGLTGALDGTDDESADGWFPGSVARTSRYVTHTRGAARGVVQIGWSLDELNYPRPSSDPRLPQGANPYKSIAWRTRRSRSRRRRVSRQGQFLAQDNHVVRVKLGPRTRTITPQKSGSGDAATRILLFPGS
jgi:hypothetical protein